MIITQSGEAKAAIMGILIRPMLQHLQLYNPLSYIHGCDSIDPDVPWDYGADRSA